MTSLLLSTLLLSIRQITALSMPRFNGSLLPRNPYVLKGGTLTLTCTHYSENTTSFFMTDPYDTKISSEYLTVVAPRVLRLDMPITDLTWHDKIVYCRDRTFSLGAGQVLTVEYPPRDMLNVTVLIDNWNTLNISWTIPKYLNMTVMEIDVQWNPGTDRSEQVFFNCSESSITNCFLDKMDYNDSDEYQFRINITNTRANVLHVQLVTIKSHRYVKAPPPEGLTANTSSRCLTATWEELENRRLHYKWTYKVRLGLDNTTISSGEVDTETYTVCDLRPDTMYDLSVSFKPGSIYWSRAFSIRVRTAEDKPEAGVPVMEGGYHVKSSCKKSSKTRTVVIFLTLPSRATWNGNLTEYQVSYIPSDGSKGITNLLPVTSLSDTVDLMCNLSYEVEITLYNNVGASPTSRLNISMDKSVARPKTVRVRISGDAVQLEWSKDEIVRTQAVFWCRRGSPPFSCEDRIQWKPVPGTDNFTFIEYREDYNYGVSITTGNGSSDIVSADCTYILDKEPTGAPKILPSNTLPPNSLGVGWMMKTCADDVLVTTIVIEHCDVNNDTSCTINRVANEDSYYSIPDLVGGVNYSIRLKAVTIDGREGPYSERVYATPIDRQASTGHIQDSKLNTHTGWAVLVGCLGAAAVIGLGAVIWRMKKGLENIDIELPRSEQLPELLTIKASNPAVLVQETETDKLKKTAEMSIPQENRPDSGFNSGSSGKEQETHPSAALESKKGIANLNTKGSYEDCTPDKEEFEQARHQDEEDRSGQTDDRPYVTVGEGDEERSDIDDDGTQDGDDQSDQDVEEERTQDGDDQSDQDVEEERTQDGDDQSNQDVEEEGSQDGDDQSNQDVEEEGSQDGDDQSNKDVEEEGTQDGDDQSNQDVEEEGTQDGDDQSNQDVEEEGSLDVVEGYSSGVEDLDSRAVGNRRKFDVEG